MEFNYSYQSDSTVRNNGKETDVSFSPDASRQPTFFSGSLAKAIPFREAISALHDVVVSDLRWHPKDRTEYLAWREQQDEIDWVAVAQQQKETAEKLEEARLELDTMRRSSAQRMQPYYTAQREYFNYLYKKNYDWWVVLDPVITVHPDEVFFECFSQDESSYGRLSVDYNVFKDVGEFACGTTNVDYSAALYDEFQKIRSYKETKLEVDPSGFEVETSGENAYKEVKIDLPDSWVRGFLQVSSAMAMPMVTFDLHPMDLHNICFVLRRRKEILGPRSIRYILTPGKPVKVVFDPWGIELECPRSKYEGDKSHEIRVWGRRRIHILERLIPIAKKFRVHLLGYGMPSFYLADLGDMTFTLGLSGWTSNDWSSSGNFDLLAPRMEVDLNTQQKVFSGLKENWYETADSLSKRLGLDRATVLGSLSAYTQAGRAIYDLNKSVYRVRELTQDPLPMDRLRFTSEREKTADTIVAGKHVKITSKEEGADKSVSVIGQVDHGDKKYDVTIQIDSDAKLKQGTCTCNFYQQNKLRKGPCEHLLALRTQFNRESGIVFAELITH